RRSKARVSVRPKGAPRVGARDASPSDAQGNQGMALEGSEKAAGHQAEPPEGGLAVRAAGVVRAAGPKGPGVADGALNANPRRAKPDEGRAPLVDRAGRRPAHGVKNAPSVSLPVQSHLRLCTGQREVPDVAGSQPGRAVNAELPQALCDLLFIEPLHDG